MDWNAVQERIAQLSQREWPAEWSAAENAAIGDYYGWCHRYRLEAPLAVDEVADFERKYGITLPEDYRQFLTQLGNGGAGPDYGIFPLGEGEEEPLPAIVLENLHQEFALNGAWNDTSLLDTPELYYGYEIMTGAMPISTRGSALDYWLVVSGPRKGEIWFDKRTDGDGVESVKDSSGNPLTFGQWYVAWLEAAFAKLDVS